MRPFGHLGFFARGLGNLSGSSSQYLFESLTLQDFSELPYCPTLRGAVSITVDGPGFGTVTLFLNSVSLPEASELEDCQLEFEIGVCPLDAIFFVILGATLCKAGTDPAQSLHPPDPMEHERTHRKTWKPGDSSKFESKGGVTFRERFPTVTPHV